MRILQNSKFSVKKSYTQLIYTLSFPGRSPVLGKYETLEKIRKKKCKSARNEEASVRL